MTRYALCCLGLLALGLPALAGELDNEKGPATSKAVPQTAPATLVKTSVPAELDREAPQQSCRCYGGWGFGGGFGCYRPCFYPGFYCYRPCFYGLGYGGYGGFGGFGGGYVGVGYGGFGRW
jgi:hypothetical protein